MSDLTTKTVDPFDLEYDKWKARKKPAQPTTAPARATPAESGADAFDKAYDDWARTKEPGAEPAIEPVPPPPDWVQRIGEPRDAVTEHLIREFEREKAARTQPVEPWEKTLTAAKRTQMRTNRRRAELASAGELMADPDTPLTVMDEAARRGLVDEGKTWSQVAAENNIAKAPAEKQLAFLQRTAFWSDPENVRLWKLAARMAKAGSLEAHFDVGKEAPGRGMFLTVEETKLFRDPGKLKPNMFRITNWRLRDEIDAMEPEERQKFLQFLSHPSNAQNADRNFLEKVLTRLDRGVEAMAGGFRDFPVVVGAEEKGLLARQQSQAILYAQDPVEGGNLFTSGILGAAQMAPPMITSAMLGNPWVMTAFWATQIAPDAFGDLRRMGLPPNASRLGAILIAIPEAAIEVLQVKQLTPKLGGVVGLRKAAQRFFWNYTKKYIQEVGEEGVQAGVRLGGKALAAWLASMADVKTSPINWTAEIEDIRLLVAHAAIAIPWMMGGGHVVGGIQQFGAEIRSYKNYQERLLANLPEGEAVPTDKQLKDGYELTLALIAGLEKAEADAAEAIDKVEGGQPPAEGEIEPTAAQTEPTAAAVETPVETEQAPVIKVTKQARALARRRGIMLDDVEGTGSKGVITEKDVERAAREAEPVAEAPEAEPAAEADGVRQAIAEGKRVATEVLERHKDIPGVEKILARRDRQRDQNRVDAAIQGQRDAVETIRETAEFETAHDWLLENDAAFRRATESLSEADIDNQLSGALLDLDRAVIDRAAQSGKPVPAEVLADYPELAAEGAGRPIEAGEVTPPTTEQPAPAAPEITPEEAVKMLGERGKEAEAGAEDELTDREVLAASISKAQFVEQELARMTRQIEGLPVRAQLDPGARAQLEEFWENANAKQEPAAKPKPEVLRDVPAGGEFDVALPQSKARIKGDLVVVDAGDVLVSSDKGYDEKLQPRDRGTRASIEQVAEYAAHLDPAQLGTSAVVDRGAPAADMHAQIVSGNARMMAIQEAYRSGKGDAYRAFVEAEAKRLGLDISGLENPVLIRRITDTGKLSMKEVAELANRSMKLQRTEAEQAEADAKTILEKGLLALYAPSASGDLMAASNRDFLNAFVQETGDESLRKSDGTFGGAIANRVRRAMLAAILGNTEGARNIVRQAVEQAEELGVRRQLDGVMTVGGELLRVAGETPKLDVSPHLAVAIQNLIEYKRAVTSGKKVSPSDWARQTTMFGGEMTTEQRLLFGELVEARSQKAVVDFFLEYVRIADRTVSGESIFGGEAGFRTVGELLEAMSREQGKGTKGLFEPRAEEPGAKEEVEPPDEGAGGVVAGEPKKPTPPGEGLAPPAKGAAAGGMAAAATGGAYGVIDAAAGPDASKPVPAAQEKSPAAAVAELAMGPIRGALDAVLKMVAPSARGEQARLSARIIRKNRAELAHEKVVTYNTFKSLRRAFWFMSREEQLNFMDNVEQGKEQVDPKLDKIAKQAGQLIEGLADQVRALGKGQLENVIENYFPHIWSSPSKASQVLAEILGRRPLEGSKGFLKKRTIPTTREGVERGLSPVSWNPVDLILLKAFEMQRYIAAQHLIRDLTPKGLVRFVYARSKTPDGYVRLNDKMFTVIAPPDISVKEAYDQILVEDLIAFASSIGVSTKRLMKMRGRIWGSANRVTGEVITKFAGPESVLIHEIGHHLGFQYKLFDWMLRSAEGEWKTITRGKRKGEQKFVPSEAAVEHRKVVNEQWRALADTRAEGVETTPGFAKYLRKQQEKEAVLLEALLHAPEKMEQIAPKVAELFKQFLNEHSELRPLLDIQPSLVLGTATGTLKVPGITTLGHYAAPEMTATLLNNHLAPGLRDSTNQIVAGGYDLLRQAGNTLNQVQLAASGFHALFTSVSVMASQVGQGGRNIGTLNPKLWAHGAVQLLTAPVALPVNLWRGSKLMKAYRTPLDEITDPHMRLMVEAAVTGGMRGEADAFYFNQAADRLVTTMGDLFKGTPGERVRAGVAMPVRLFKAGIEAMMTPILKWLVPHQKFGMFAMLAKDEMVRLKNQDVTDDVLHQRLSEVADSVDNRLGQLIYDNLFWNKTFKDLLMLSVRSVGWNLGFIREYAVGPVVDVATTVGRMKRGDALISLRMTELGGTVVFLGVLGAVMNYVVTGKPPEEPKDYFFPKTGRLNPDGSEERLSLPTYAKDLAGWGTRPVQTAKNKLHPILGVIADTLQNADFYGTEIRHPDDPVVQQLVDVAKHVGKQFTTFSMRNWTRMREAGASKTQAAFVSATGITAAPTYVTKTAAQKLMQRYVVSRMPRGTRTRAAYDKSKLRGMLKNRLRLGKPIEDLEAEKHLRPAEIAAVRREARLPAFAQQFKRLTIVEALNVYTVATDKERRLVRPLLGAKYENAADSYSNDPTKWSRDDWQVMTEMYRLLMRPKGKVKK